MKPSGCLLNFVNQVTKFGSRFNELSQGISQALHVETF